MALCDSSFHFEFLPASVAMLTTLLVRIKVVVELAVVDVR